MGWRAIMPLPAALAVEEAVLEVEPTEMEFMQCVKPQARASGM